MPRKPRPTRHRDDRRVPNEHYTAAGGALQARNAVLAAAAVDLELADVAAGQPLRMRYSRVRAALVKKYKCSRSVAERAIADGKVIRLQQWHADLPNKRAGLSMQLQRIADANEEKRPGDSIAAIAQIGRFNGLYAPQKIAVVRSEQLELEQIVKVLPPWAKEALDKVLEGIEWARSQGLLPAEGGTSGPEPEQIDDAEIVEPDRGELSRP